MFNQIFVVFAAVLLASVSAAPGAKAEAKPLIVAATPLAYTAPFVSAPVVTATSSQSFIRNYNGLAVSAPLVAAASPYAGSYSAYSPYVAYPSAYTAYPSAAYVASPYAAGVPVLV